MEEVIGERDEEPVGGVETSGWAELVEKAVEVAKEVCGVSSRSVENPWMMGREEEIERSRRAISGAVERRNELATAERRGEVEEEEEVERAREELKRLMGEWKRTLKRWEREWWQGVAEEC